MLSEISIKGGFIKIGRLLLDISNSTLHDLTFVGTNNDIYEI